MEHSISIINSILGQIGGPLSYEDVGIKYQGEENFYTKWHNYRQYYFKDLKSLPEKDKIFLLVLVKTVNTKLSWEAQTVTGYNDIEREKAIEDFERLLDINIEYNESLPSLPGNLA